MKVHPVFGAEMCRRCGKPAELVCDPYWVWHCCGDRWYVVGSPMDVANELIDATILENEDEEFLERP